MDFIITSGKCLRIICVHYKLSLRSGLVALKGDTSTICRFCPENCWWELLPFQLYSAPISSYNFTSDFMLHQYWFG